MDFLTGMGPLCHQLQLALKQQERLASNSHGATIKVVSCEAEGPILFAQCSLQRSASGNADLPDDMCVMLKTEPRIDVSPGDCVNLYKPWQSLTIDGVLVLLVQHADVSH